MKLKVFSFLVYLKYRVREVIKMNKDSLKGKWKQLKGDIKSKWGKLTDDDIKEIEGNQEKLVGKIQDRYGKNKEEAKKEYNDWIDGV